MIKQYEDAQESIPQELINQDGADADATEADAPKKRSWFSRLTFGLFD